MTHARSCFSCLVPVTDKLVCQTCIDDGKVGYFDLTPDLPMPPKATDESEIPVRYSDKIPPSLKEMQDFVGGWIELVMLRDGSQMIINEEGRIHGMPLNTRASRLYGGPIAGPAWILQDNARLD